MASSVCNEIATKYDPKNHVLNYCLFSKTQRRDGRQCGHILPAGKL